MGGVTSIPIHDVTLLHGRGMNSPCNVWVLMVMLVHGDCGYIHCCRALTDSENLFPAIQLPVPNDGPFISAGRSVSYRDNSISLSCT